VSSPVVPTSARAAVAGARDQLIADGWHLLPAAEMAGLVGAGPADWDRFGRNWDDLTVDRYMRDGGTYRRRRYGHFVLDTTTRALTVLPHGSYRQETEVNPLNGGIDRHFDPLTEAFLADPLTTAIVLTLGEIFAAVEGEPIWDVKLHPFRITNTPLEYGKPAPQGRHRDGGTFVTSLLVGRSNVTGGESSVWTDDGIRLFSGTMLEPGDQILLDDRRLMHDVTDLQPVDDRRPSHRDVLIIDFDVAGGGAAGMMS
jgi:hypothetical protein